MPATAITEAVFARVLSSQKPQRMAAAKVLGGPVGPARHRPDRSVRGRCPRRLVCLQGGRLRPGVRADRGRRGLWLGGGAGRAGHHLAAASSGPGSAPMRPIPAWGTCCSPTTSDAVGQAQDAWRRVVATAVTLGVPTPASPPRWPTMTACASVARPTCSRPSATSSAPTPTGGSTARQLPHLLVPRRPGGRRLTRRPSLATGLLLVPSRRLRRIGAGRDPTATAVRGPRGRPGARPPPDP